ncbi:unnamed protein product [Lota lota]
MLVHRPWTVTWKRKAPPCSMATVEGEEEETDEAEAEEDDSAVAATTVAEMMVEMTGEWERPRRGGRGRGGFPMSYWPGDGGVDGGVQDGDGDTFDVVTSNDEDGSDGGGDDEGTRGPYTSQWGPCVRRYKGAIDGVEEGVDGAEVEVEEEVTGDQS